MLHQLLVHQLLLLLLMMMMAPTQTSQKQQLQQQQHLRNPVLPLWQRSLPNSNAGVVATPAVAVAAAAAAETAVARQQQRPVVRTGQMTLSLVCWQQWLP
jgi:hypothetical protein